MLLLAAALIPPLFLLVKIYKLDKIESEPIGLIIKLFIFGAITVFPAGFLESYLGDGLLKSLIPDTESVLYRFVFYFFVVALVEELVKYIALKFGSWRHPAFDYQFDGIVYSVAVTLGFAALENIGYVSMFGPGTAAVRAVTAIPGHCIFGIFMGHYYGMAKKCELMGDSVASKRFRMLAVISPMIMHGFYDFAASSDSEMLSIIFFIYIIILDIFAFRAINKYAKEDQKMDNMY